MYMFLITFVYKAKISEKKKEKNVRTLTKKEIVNFARVLADPANGF